jgi:transcriptional regulator with XRE-family HTH domain
LLNRRSTIHRVKQYVREAAKRRGLTLRELTAEAKISPDTLYRIFRGETGGIGIVPIYRLARALRIAPIVLLRLVFRDINLGDTSDPVPIQHGDHSAFVEDVTYPDGAVVLASTRFVKRWLIQNAGTVPWLNRRLVCYDTEYVMARRLSNGTLEEIGSPLLTPLSRELPIPDTQPANTVELSVEFYAPDLPCDALSMWKMVDERGVLCFPDRVGVWCRVHVTGIDYEQSNR